MSEISNIRQIIIMRNDLGMRKGKMIAQGAHASMKVFLDCAETHHALGDSWLRVALTADMLAWVDGIFTKICVRVDSQAELFFVYEAAKAAGLPAALIQDAGHTEFKEPTYTCCAIGPAPKSSLDPITGHLKLL